MVRFEIRGSFYLLAALWLLLIPLRWVLGMVLTALIHELGHIAAIRLTRGTIHALELSAGGARIVTGPMEPGQELLCALAGPLAGGCVMLLWRCFPEAALAALMQTTFNLLPIYPLDGGRAIRAARNICCKREDFRVQ